MSSVTAALPVSNRHDHKRSELEVFEARIISRGWEPSPSEKQILSRVKARSTTARRLRLCGSSVHRPRKRPPGSPLTHDLD